MAVTEVAWGAICWESMLPVYQVPGGSGGRLLRSRSCRMGLVLRALTYCGSASMSVKLSVKLVTNYDQPGFLCQQWTLYL